MNNNSTSSAFGEVAKVAMSSLSTFAQPDENKILEIRKKISGSSSTSRTRTYSAMNKM